MALTPCEDQGRLFTSIFKVLGPMVSTPFLYQTVHVKKAPWICLFQANFSSRPSRVASMPSVFIQFNVLIAEPPSCACTSTRCKFPFRFRWKTPSTSEAQIDNIGISMVQMEKKFVDIIHVDLFNRTKPCTPSLLKF